MFLCIICFYSMDYNIINTMFGTDLQPSPFFEEFAFGCYKEAHFWDLER
jgi:hypothetical protein